MLFCYSYCGFSFVIAFCIMKLHVYEELLEHSPLLKYCSSLNCSFPHLSVLDKFLFVWSVNDNKLHHLLGAFIYKAFKHRLLYYESKLKPTLNSAQSVHIYNIHLVAMTNWPSLVL